MARAEHLAAWMRGQVAEAGAQGLVVALSGGVDSAVVARLSQLAAPGAVIGVLLPCHSAPEDERDAALVAGHLSLPTVRIDLAPAYDPLVAGAQAALEKLPVVMRETPRKEPPHDDPRARVPQANMKPRLRMTALYFIANSLSYLVAGTGNRSELSIGYFTKYGDGGVDILPLANLAKREVRALARDLGLPPAIIDRTPTAGLWAGQTDEAEMGFTYDQLERYLDDGAEGVAPALAMRIERLVRATEHKRRLPPSPPRALENPPNF